MASPASVTAGASPFEAAQQAIEHTRRLLFPFRFERWLALGFVAFLDQCGRVGTVGGSGAPPAHWEQPTPSLPSLPHLPELPAWVADNLGWLIAAGVMALAVVVALVTVVLWLGSRGVFMYLDDVASGRAEVVRPWREHAELATSLFLWRLGVAGGALLGGFVVLCLGALALRMMVHGAYVGGVALLLTLLPVTLVLGLGAALLSVALRDFVAPIQLALRVPCGQALTRFLDLVQAHPGTFVVYAFLKIVFAIALGLAVFVVGCATCCIGFLPVIAQTLFQPAYFFERAWSLYLLRVMGYDLVSGPATPPAAS